MVHASPFGYLSNWVHYYNNNIVHRVAKVYLNCDQCDRGGTITSLVQPDSNDYVIVHFTAV